ncbi:MAG: HlyC/CorC family transporter [Bacteroidetes bacterium]|nr:HlyC/CorC family transporter [Bacteroidota bacterium]MBS1610777.1 HlyC/CorC family transporter [Bacteroidota bacterium]
MDLKTTIWFILTLLLMGFFAGIEMAFYGANRLAIELKKKQGGTTGQLLGQFIDSPVRFLGTTLIGFNLFLVFFSLQISDVMRPLWDFWHMESNVVRLIVEIVISTFIVLVFAELIPRAIFRARSNALLSGFSRIIDFFYQMFHPLASALIKLSEWVLKYVFNIRVDEQKEVLGRSDLENLFQQSKDDHDENHDLNTELFENALELPKIKIRQSLVPRKEIVGVDVKSSVADLKNKFIETKLSRLLVFDNNIDHILGYVHQLDLFKNPASVESVLLPIPAVPESMSVTDLINKFTKERKSIAWVVDEFGGTAGIITMEDLLEEIFGEIQDEYDTEEFVEKQLSENEYIFSGRLEVDYLNEKYHFEFPVTESETLSGYIINFHETIPRQKERIIIDDYEFDVLSVTDTRIEMVKLKVLK